MSSLNQTMHNFLKKKRRLETLKAFLEDVTWAKSLYDSVVPVRPLTDGMVQTESMSDGGVQVESMSDRLVQVESMTDGEIQVESMTDRTVQVESMTDRVAVLTKKLCDDVATDGVAPVRPLTEGVVQVEPMTDRAVQEESMTDRVAVLAQKLKKDDGVAPIRPLNEGTLQVEPMSNRAVQDKSMTEGDIAVQDEPITDGAVEGESMTDGDRPVQVGAVQDESMTEGDRPVQVGAVQDEFMTDQAVQNEFMTDGYRADPDESMTEGDRAVHVRAVKDESMADDESMTEGDRAVQEESMTEGDRAVQDGSMTEGDGAVQDEPITDGAVEDESMTEGDRAVQDESITEGDRAVQDESMTEEDRAVQDKSMTEGDGAVQDKSTSERVVQVESITDKEVQVESTSEGVFEVESITDEAVHDEPMTDGAAVLSQNKDADSTTYTVYISDSEYESDTIPILFPQLSSDKLKVAHKSGEKRPHSQVDYDDVDDDIDRDFNEDEILRDERKPALYIRKLLRSTTTKLGKKKKDDRVYNSYHNCTYCDKLWSNFAQHIKRRHLKEADVKNIYEISDEKERKRQIALLSAEMDHVHNMKMKKNEKGEIILYRRPSAQFQFDSFGPCPSCYLWISKRMLPRHQNNCIGSSEKKLKYSELITRSDTIADRIPDVASSALVKEVFSKMNHDDIAVTARDDSLIVRLGNMWMEKNIGNKLKRGKYTSQIMRMVARLLNNIQKETNTDLSLSEYLKPCYFDDIAKATLITAGRDATDGEYLENPSNAIKLGHDIKRIVNIKIGVAIMLKDRTSEEDGERFLKLMNVFWGTRVTKLARNTLVERQFNKRQVLPDPKDIQKLNEYLNTHLSNIDVEEVSKDNYTKVTRLVATKLVQYNRRRPGEIEALTLEDYGARIGGTSESHSAMFGDLTKFERKLMEKQDVLETRGKGHRGVPILIPEVAKAGIAYIASSQVRKAVGINSGYLFALSGSEFRLYDCLAEHCEKADLSYPERITATTLRKYMATVTQALDLKPHQVEWVMRHMGHSLDVHKIYYRSTSDIIERTQVAKILLLQDTGRLNEFSNQRLEDIQLSELAEEASDRPDDVPLEELFIASENMDEDENMDEEFPSAHEGNETRPGQPAKKNSAQTRQKWSSDEEKEIRQIFEKYFEEKRRPTPKQCSNAIRISKKKGGAIHLRKKDVLKKKVYRMIDNLKK